MSQSAGLPTHFPITPAQGGTGQTTYTTGDILYASSADTLSKLPIGAASQILTVSAGLPSWQDAAGGSVESVSGTTDRITSTGGTTPIIDIANTYVGQASITTLGTISTGVWNGTVIGTLKGGTGITSYATGDLLYASASNTLSNLTINAIPGRSLITTGTTISWNSPGKYVYFFDDMFNSGFNGAYPWRTWNANSGDIQQIGTAANPGVNQITTATNTNGAAGMTIAQDNSARFPIILGGGTWTIIFYCKLSALSDGTDTYATVFGLTNANGSSDPADGVYFKYTDTGASPNWTINCIKSGAGTSSANSGIAASSAAYHKFQISSDSTAANIRFYIDDVETSNSPISSANIPNVAPIGPMIKIVKSAGTNARRIDLDYVEMFGVLTTSR